MSAAKRITCVVIFDTVAIDARFYRDDALKPHDRKPVWVDYWESDPTQIIVSELDGRLIKRIVAPEAALAYTQADAARERACHDDQATPVEVEVEEAVTLVAASKAAWAFNGEQLQRAMAEFFNVQLRADKMEEIEAALFKGLLIAFLMSPEAKKLRIAMPAEVKV